MVKKLLCGALVSLSVLCSSCGDSNKHSDREDVALRGKVKSVTEKQYHAVLSETGDVVKGSFFRMDGEWDYTEKFNSKGMFTSVSFLDRDGDTISKRIYEYDEDGKLATKSFYDPSLKVKSQYEYDASGRVKLVYDFDADGDLMVATTTEYNDDNRIETTTKFNKQGKYLEQSVSQKNKLGFVTDFKYYNNERKLGNWRKEVHADDGRLLEMTVLNQDESVAFMVKYEYNKQGDLVTCSPYSEDEEYIADRYLYEYDKKSNWRRRIHFKGDSAYSVTERIIEYY